MPKIYLLGGENVLRRSAREINLKAFQDAAQTPNVLVFPWARASFDKKYGKRKLLADYFLSMGAASVDFAEYAEAENLAEKLEHSDVVYLTGGQAVILTERAKKGGLDHLLESYKGVIVGRSAGALALCRRCITTCRYNSKVHVAEGLGLIDITMKAHYLPHKDETLKQFSIQTPIFSVPKDSALVCDNGCLSAIGKVYLFQDGQKQAFTKGKL